MPYLNICLEGNLAAGKTRMLGMLGKWIPKAEMVPEPVEQWTAGDNLLEKYYKDPQAYAGQFQWMVLNSLKTLHDQPLPEGKQARIVERSVFSSFNVFSKIVQGRGFMTTDYRLSMHDWLKYHCKQGAPATKVDLFVYIRIPPEVSWERVCARGRSEENSVSPDLLKAYHEEYDKWLLQKKKACPRSVLIVDGMRTDESYYRRLAWKLIVWNSNQQHNPEFWDFPEEYLDFPELQRLSSQDLIVPCAESPQICPLSPPKETPIE